MISKYLSNDGICVMFPSANPTLLLFCLPLLNLYICLNYALLYVLYYTLFSNQFLCAPSPFLHSLISFSLQLLFLLHFSSRSILCGEKLLYYSHDTVLQSLDQRAAQETMGEFQGLRNAVTLQHFWFNSV